MQIQKYEGNNGVKIIQIQLSDEDIKSRLFKQRKELTQDEYERLWNLDGKQRT